MNTFPSGAASLPRSSTAVASIPKTENKQCFLLLHEITHKSYKIATDQKNGLKYTSFNICNINQCNILKSTLFHFF